MNYTSCVVGQSAYVDFEYRVSAFFSFPLILAHGSINHLRIDMLWVVEKYRYASFVCCCYCYLLSSLFHFLFFKLLFFTVSRCVMSLFHGHLYDCFSSVVSMFFCCQHLSFLLLIVFFYCRLQFSAISIILFCCWYFPSVRINLLLQF